MKHIFLRIDSRVVVRLLSGTATAMLWMNVAGSDGKTSPVTVKSSVPVYYYEGIMIGLAMIYGIYLVARARRRKRRNAEKKRPDSIGTTL